MFMFICSIVCSTPGQNCRYLPSHMSSLPKLYCAWFCPFAQRAWIALLYRHIEFEYVEQDPYNMTPEWLAINPRGLVPTIVHNGKSVYDSQICMEYIDEAWPGGNNALLPRDPYERALVRMWSDHISKKIVPPFYALLMKETEKERQESKDAILDNILLLTEVMSVDGPFFLGKDFGMVDIMLVPWAIRIPVLLKTMRNFEIPNDAKFARYHRWWNAVKELEAVKKTVQPQDKLMDKYQRYIDGTAKTQVADAIRKGTGLP